MNDETVREDRKELPEKTLSFFERYLSVWVASCIAVGIAVGQFIPAIPNTLGEIQYARVNIPIA
ncbi:arsenical-resistance protein, partial [Candidatus Bipolaricaulota bacterium]|nr:arsenical-resistance protein [Candidatus Bipolaricaulota bacterium]